MTSPPIPDPTDRAALRRWLRSRRRAIQGPARRQAAQLVARAVAASRWLKPGRCVGLYLSMPEELDTAPLLQLAQRRGCRIAVPRITSVRHNRMCFFDLEGAVEKGAFGIAAPLGDRMRPARQMDVVFVPLVGFDPAGHRIGMGRGFYDRFFAHRGRMHHWRRPLLIGIAYDAQCVPLLPASSHDVPLDAIVTESTVLRFRRVGS
ncbi:MAG TPA: 5-formyltetrahydrofolate cyclo-ligase [Steroidobacteraceae bacterium]|nr:5-formyltetrahydrofolate cyclo-ligase [Steroidobacteraceae bacterium]